MIWEPVEIVAFVEPRSEHAGKGQSIYGARGYADYRTMFAEEDLDGVLVVSSDDLHLEHGTVSFEAGYHVLVEKPIARSLYDARQMCLLADEHRPTLMSVANKRFSPPNFRAIKAILDWSIHDPAMFVGKFTLGYDYVDLLESGTIHLFDLIIEFHGRLSVSEADTMIKALQPFRPLWCEEPVAPESLDLLLEVKRKSSLLIAAGERLYTISDFHRLTTLRGADIIQMDIAHCGGIHISKKIAAMADAQDIRIAPHCLIGPVALAAALHFDVSTPNFMIQESFAEFDVPWRDSLVHGWNPVRDGELYLTDAPGLGCELDDDVIAQHPYIQNPFPSLWDDQWVTEFTQDKKS